MADNRVSMTFSRSLYTPEAVQAAAEAYSGLARVTVEVGAHDLRVDLELADDHGREHAERVEDGFRNHALFETIVQSRRELGGALA